LFKIKKIIKEKVKAINMSEEKVDLESIKKLIARDKNFAFILDYALSCSR